MNKCKYMSYKQRMQTALSRPNIGSTEEEELTFNNAMDLVFRREILMMETWKRDVGKQKR